MNVATTAFSGASFFSKVSPVPLLVHLQFFLLLLVLVIHICIYLWAAISANFL
jgi:hypothetical protein